MDCYKLDKRIFECEFCGEKFDASKTLVVHHRIHREAEPHNFSDKSVSVWSFFNSHEEMSSKEQSFQSQQGQISSQSPSKSPLKTIAQPRAHTSKELNQCSKSSKKTTALKNHNRIHNKEKPFTCQYCKKSFAKSSELKVHQRTHTGERPFKCKHCNKSFTQSSHLGAHQRIHTGERSFQCKHCGKLFNQSGNLERHIRFIREKNHSSASIAKNHLVILHTLTIISVF